MCFTVQIEFHYSVLTPLGKPVIGLGTWDIAYLDHDKPVQIELFRLTKDWSILVELFSLKYQDFYGVQRGLFYGHSRKAQVLIRRTVWVRKPTHRLTQNDRVKRLRHETVEPHPLEESHSPGWNPDAPDTYRVGKMAYAGPARNPDRTAIVCNAHITLTSIPGQAHEYRLGSRARSAALHHRPGEAGNGGKPADGGDSERVAIPTVRRRRGVPTGQPGELTATSRSIGTRKRT